MPRSSARRYLGSGSNALGPGRTPRVRVERLGSGSKVERLGSGSNVGSDVLELCVWAQYLRAAVARAGSPDCTTPAAVGRSDDRGGGLPHRLAQGELSSGDRAPLRRV
ncbi:MAG: hypothetical protein ABSC94_04125 [Polyangiaceae bacterium]